MKRETKLWLRKHALMALRAIVWHVDEWIQRQEVALREEIEDLVPRTVACQTERRPATAASHRAVLGAEDQRGSAGRKRETFEQWEMRKSGVRLDIKRMRSRTRRRRPNASEFDRSIFEKRKDWLQ